MLNHYFLINFFCVVKKSQRMRNDNFLQFNMEKEMFVWSISKLKSNYFYY